MQDLKFVFSTQIPSYEWQKTEMRWNWYFLLSGCTLLSLSWFLTLKLKVVCLLLLVNSHIASAQLSSVTCWSLIVLQAENYSQQIMRFSHEITKFINLTSTRRAICWLPFIALLCGVLQKQATQNLNKTSSLSYFPSHTEHFCRQQQFDFFSSTSSKEQIFFHLRLFLFLLFHNTLSQ